MTDADDVVVGVDGSEPSRQALRWAVEETDRGGGGLRVVLAYRWERAARFLADDDADEVAKAQADAIVEQAVAEAKAVAPGVTVVGAAVRANPAVALLDAAEQARLVVVSNRGRGGFANLALGSVGLRVATHAPCPVAVVRGRAEDRSGPVVIGLNGSASATPGLGLGFAQAAARGCGLVAARAYTSLTPPHDPVWLRAELIRAITPWHGRYPQVPVEYVLFHGPSGDFLTNLSHRAQLVVVGSRGSGGFTGLLLGSISQQLIHNADCPVLIARRRTGD